MAKKNAPQAVKDVLRPAHRMVVNGQWSLSRKSEYEEGMDEDTRERLESVFVEDARRFSSYVDRNLSHWFEDEEIYVTG